MKTEKIETKKVVSYIRGMYHKREEWLIINNHLYYGYPYHREDGPALTYYYKDGTIAVERWYNIGRLRRPIEEGPAETLYYKNGNIKLKHWVNKYGEPSKSISYYENGNIMSESKDEYDPIAKCYRYIKIEYYEDGTIKEKSDSGTFEGYDSNYNRLSNSYEFKYYENGNIKSERRGPNEQSSLDKPIVAEYDINGNILKAKYYLYNVGFITQTQLNKYNKRLQSKIKIKTSDPKTLEILYRLAEKYNYTDKMDQIGALLVANKLTEN